jgi:hypothetical protein
MLAALIINRSGGLKPSPKARGTPADPRDFMWQPLPEPEATPEFLNELFGIEQPVKHGKKQQKSNQRTSAGDA